MALFATAHQVANVPMHGAVRHHNIVWSGEEVARPEGFEHTPPTIVIEGVAAMVEALRAA